MKVSMLVCPLLMASAMLLSRASAMAENQDSAKVTALLENAREHAMQANLNAEQIEGYTRSTTHWSSHSRQLSQMKENVNAMGKDVAELAAIRGEGTMAARGDR